MVLKAQHVADAKRRLAELLAKNLEKRAGPSAPSPKPESPSPNWNPHAALSEEQANAATMPEGPVKAAVTEKLAKKEKKLRREERKGHEEAAAAEATKVEIALQPWP